jgi:Fe(3+) dicitrate transport protein
MLGPLRTTVLRTATLFATLAAAPSVTAQPTDTSEPPRAPEPSAPAEPPPPPAKRAEPPPPDVVQVRGEAADRLVRESGSQTRVSKQDLERQRPLSTNEVFRRIPGMTVREEDGMGMRLNIGIRGFNPSRSRLVLVTEDGVPVVVSPYGEPEMYYSPPIERVERLEVRKGPEILTDGPQTVAGVVDLHDWSPPDKRTWAVEADYGQRSYAKALGRYGDSFGDVRVVAQVMRKQGDGFRDMRFDATDALLKVGLPVGRSGDLVLRGVVYDETSHTTYVGMTNPMFLRDPRQPTVAPDDVFKIRRYEGSAKHTHRVSNDVTLDTTLYVTNTNLRIGQQDFDRGRSADVRYARVLGDPAITGGALFFRDTRSLRDRDYVVAGLDPRLEARWVTGDVRHKVTAGVRGVVDSTRRQLSRAPTPTSEDGTRLTDDTTTILAASAFLQDQMAFRDDLVVTPGIRVEHAWSRRWTALVLDRDQPTPVDRRGSTTATGVMPGIAFAYGSPRWNLFWGLHSGYSPPRISQSISPSGADTGLDAERSVNYELGTRMKAGKWGRFELTGFMVNFDNQLVSNNPLTSGNLSEFKNGGATRQLGAEATALVTFARTKTRPVRVDLSAQYTYVDARFRGGKWNGNIVPYSPDQQLTLTADGELASGFGAQVSWSRVGQQFVDERNTTKADPTGLVGEIKPYNVLDLGLRYRHAPTGIGARLVVKNVLDDVYLGSRLPNGIFTSGFRQIIAGLSWSGP